MLCKTGHHLNNTRVAIKSRVTLEKENYSTFIIEYVKRWRTKNQASSAANADKKSKTNANVLHVGTFSLESAIQM